MKKHILVSTLALVLVGMSSVGQIASASSRYYARSAQPQSCANGSSLNLAETRAHLADGTIRVVMGLDHAHNKAVGSLLNNTGCSINVSQITYKVYDQVLSHQRFYDHFPKDEPTEKVPAHTSVMLRTNLANCMTQTDLYFGEGDYILEDSNNEGNTLSYLFDQNYTNNYYNAAGSFCYSY
jgi:hypothetical protein